MHEWPRLTKAGILVTPRDHAVVVGHSGQKVFEQAGQGFGLYAPLQRGDLNRDDLDSAIRKLDGDDEDMLRDKDNLRKGNVLDKILKRVIVRMGEMDDPTVLASTRTVPLTAEPLMSR